MRSKEQKLIDIMFQVAYTVAHHKDMKSKPWDEQAKWISDQLNATGFKGGPIGMSWHTLGVRNASKE